MIKVRMLSYSTDVILHCTLAAFQRKLRNKPSHTEFWDPTWHGVNIFFTSVFRTHVIILYVLVARN
jgi:hypothetical protein